MLDVLSKHSHWIRPVHNLANTPFEPGPFRAACEALAPLDASSSDEDLWYFAVDPGFPLLVAVDSAATGARTPGGRPLRQPVRVLNAVLSVCWWEPPEPRQAGLASTHGDERRQFDECYGAVRDRAATDLAAPLLEGRDEDEHGCRWALWRGRTGLFVVQQSAYDPQFGLDINYWVTPWTGPDPQPSSPFIDWLMGLSERGEPGPLAGAEDE